jgi:hypothetical protein
MSADISGISPFQHNLFWVSIFVCTRPWIQTPVQPKIRKEMVRIIAYILICCIKYFILNVLNNLLKN